MRGLHIGGGQVRGPSKGGEAGGNLRQREAICPAPGGAKDRELSLAPGKKRSHETGATNRSCQMVTSRGY